MFIVPRGTEGVHLEQVYGAISSQIYQGSLSKREKVYPGRALGSDIRPAGKLGIVAVRGIGSED